MKRKPHSTSLVLLLLCIFTFWWGVSVLAQHDTVQSPVALHNTLPQTNAGTAPVLVNQTYANGVFTYSGMYTPQNACDSFGSGIDYGGGHVSVLLITAPATIACAQAAGASDAQPFTVSIKLGPNTVPQFDGVTLNGNPIPAQLVVGN
jgi:hypothetical protein